MSLRWITETWRHVRGRRGKPQRGPTLIGLWMKFLTKPWVCVRADADTHLRFDHVPALLAQRRAIQTLQGDIPEEGRVFQTAGGRRVRLEPYPPRNSMRSKAFQAGDLAAHWKAIELGRARIATGIALAGEADHARQAYTTAPQE